MVDRATVLEAGGSDDFIQVRLQNRIWRAVHSGVYLLGAAPLTWRGRLRAATLACGPDSLISHRTAAQLWGLDLPRFPRIEVTVPYTHGPTPEGLLVHRTRRRMVRAEIDAIPVTPTERAILDCAWMMSTPGVELLYDSAIRQRLLSPFSMADCLAEFGTKGVRGRHKVASVLDSRRVGSPLGSAAETQALRLIQEAGVEEPVRQFVVILPDGSTALLDFAWPHRLKAIEIDGLVAHATARQLELDLIRQNLLFEIGWQLRRFAARTVQRQPALVRADIAAFLAA
ncbi:MAG TPA: hypothetical protein VJ796_05965 [Acidimicrobiia bacterium]|nr:hypothetical protein [Acidimicrobiia bacterium]